MAQRNDKNGDPQGVPQPLPIDSASADARTQRKETTPELEALRKAQARKGASIDPAQILDRAIYHLWETINDLEQIQPDRVEHFRVSIFGSSRIQKGDPIYDEVKKLSHDLAHLGVDIVTGGGPGLMEAANAGAVEGQRHKRSRSFGLAIHLEAEEGVNTFVDKVYKHRTFFSRLHHFVRLSSAYIVMPGGIGTCLELYMIWQLLQVKHIKQHPLILVGNMWYGLIEWMKENMEDRHLVSPLDMSIVTVVSSGAEAIPLIKSALDKFEGDGNGGQRAAGTRRPKKR